MTKYTREDIIRIVRQEEVRFIRLQFTDILGTLKNVAITCSQLERALDNGCMFDGSSIEGFVRIEESDMYLYPDLDSFAIFPALLDGQKIARLICDVYCHDGQPFAGDPRYVLRRAIAQADKMGYTFNIGPECEFFLFHADENGRATLETDDEGSYFDLGPVDKGEICRRDICLALEEIGFEIETSHHESAVAQHEIDFKYDEVLRTADNVMTFKYVVKCIAQKHGLHATFMPKPVFGMAGSGMHTNMSLFRGEQNAFYDPNDPIGLSEEAYQFVAGLMRHIKPMMLITNPLVNSYKRLVPGYEAPIYIAWSAKNRSPLIRIPTARGQGTRIELRNPDPACNPYLEMAVCLMAGLDGIRQGLLPPLSIDSNIYDMSRVERQEGGIDSLPRSLEEAIAHYKNSEFMQETLGEHVFQKYLTAKQEEWQDYRQRVTSWEVENYLVKY